MQYFAIVWWSEKGTLTGTLRLTHVGWGRAITLAFFVLTVTVVGIWYQVVPATGLPWALSLAIVISLMHFWYDGFIWSVRDHQI